MKPAKDRVSASRVPALWGEHRYLTRRMLWEYTARGIEPDRGPDPRARSGREMERAVLTMAAEDLNCEIVPLPQGPDAYLRHAELPLGCKADGYVVHPEHGPGLISAKCVSNVAWVHRWMGMRHGVPRDVEMQLQAELVVWRNAQRPESVNTLGEWMRDPAAEGVHVTVEESLPALADALRDPPRWGAIAAMNDLDVSLYRRDFEEGFEAMLVEELARFFESIEADDPPPFSYHHDELGLALELWPAKGEDFQIVDADPDVDYAIGLLMDAAERRKAAKKDEDEAKLVILEAAEGAQLIRGKANQCKVSHVQVRPSLCPHCQGIVRRGHTYAKFTPKAI